MSKAMMVGCYLAAIGFGALPFVVLGVSLEAMFYFFCGAIMAKWLIFGFLMLPKVYPERSRSVFQMLGDG